MFIIRIVWEVGCFFLDFCIGDFDLVDLRYGIEIRFILRVLGDLMMINYI